LSSDHDHYSFSGRSSAPDTGISCYSRTLLVPRLRSLPPLGPSSPACLFATRAGVLFNDVTAGIPVDRLLVSDIAKRPGAVAAVIIITLVILVIVLFQANSVRKTGWLLTYLGWYAIFMLILLILATIPGLQFRFHHYFAGLFIMPAVGFANRPSAVYQAFLLGMFLNGAGRWGFDSILQTVEEVRRDVWMCDA
jgi:amino acid transporter